MLIGTSILCLFILVFLSYQPIIADENINNYSDICINEFEFLNTEVDPWSGAYVNLKLNIKNIGTSDYTGRI